MRIKKVLSLFLATVMATSCFSGAFAENSVPVKVTAGPAVMSVTVPLSFPCEFDENFDMIVPTKKPTITNNSLAPIEIKETSIIYKDSWHWGQDKQIKQMPIDSTALAFQLKDSSMTSTAPADISSAPSSFDALSNAIPSNGSMKLDYKLIIPVQSQALDDETICDVVFVFGWADATND